MDDLVKSGRGCRPVNFLMGPKTADAIFEIKLPRNCKRGEATGYLGDIMRMTGTSSDVKKTAKAVSIGHAAFDALRRNVVGMVHSVFERTFNIIVGGELVGVARSGISLSPIDLITDISASEVMPDIGVKKGMAVRVVGDRIIVGEVLEILFAGVKPWRSPTRVEKPLEIELIERNLEIAKRTAVARAGREGLGQLLNHVDAIVHGERPAAHDLNEVVMAALRHVVKLVRTARSGDIVGVDDAAKNLIGLGPGLSPSADDMLSGFTSALWWFSRSLGKGFDRVVKINETIVSRASGTNLLSRQLLQHAARGEVNEHLGELLKALLGGRPSEIGTLVDRVMKIGETSGIDMMVGVLFGIKLWLEINGISKLDRFS